MRLRRITRLAVVCLAISLAWALFAGLAPDHGRGALQAVWAAAGELGRAAPLGLEPETVTTAFRALFSVLVAVIVPVYVVKYGWSNFLWFSDIGLLGVFAALWLENALLGSMMAVAVLVPEILWVVSFLSGLLRGRSVTTLAGYMFDARIPLYLRCLSLFHLALPPAVIWLLYRHGYDERALLAQCAFAWLVLPASLWWAPVEKNVNWVRGFGHPARRFTSLPWHFAIMMVAYPVLIYLPTHLLLLWLFA